jgi:hypothetical protein
VAYAAVDDAPTPGGPLSVEASTLVGKVAAAELTASDSILHAAPAAGDGWTAPVLVERRQQGYVRYSYVPLGSQLPPRYRCQPEDPVRVPQVVPTFTTLRFGAAAYCQLHTGCAHEIRCGASDESEMGAYHRLFAPQRATGLGVRLDEFLPFGLEAGLLFPS